MHHIAQKPQKISQATAQERPKQQRTADLVIPVEEEALALRLLAREEAKRGEHADAAVRELRLTVPLHLQPQLDHHQSCSAAKWIEVLKRSRDKPHVAICAAIASWGASRDSQSASHMNVAQCALLQTAHVRQAYGHKHMHALQGANGSTSHTDTGPHARTHGRQALQAQASCAPEQVWSSGRGQGGQSSPAGP